MFEVNVKKIMEDKNLPASRDFPWVASRDYDNNERMKEYCNTMVIVINSY